MRRRQLLHLLGVWRCTLDVTLKYDLTAGSAAEHRLPGGMQTDEPFFVPAASGAEDEGWLIAYAYDPSRAKRASSTSSTRAT